MKLHLSIFVLFLLFVEFLDSSKFFPFIYCQNNTTAILNYTEYNFNPFNYEKLAATILNYTEYNSVPFEYEKLISTNLNTTQYNEVPFVYEKLVSTYPNSSQYNELPFTYEKLVSTILNTSEYNNNPFEYEKLISTSLNITQNNTAPFEYEKLINTSLVGSEILFYYKFFNVTPTNGTQIFCANKILFNVTVANPKVIHDVFVTIQGKKYYLTKVSEDVKYINTNLGMFQVKVGKYSGYVDALGSGNTTYYVCVNTTECAGEPGCWHICKPINLYIFTPKFVNLNVTNIPKGAVGVGYINLYACNYYNDIIVKLKSNCGANFEIINSNVPTLFGKDKALIMEIKPLQRGVVKFLYKIGHSPSNSCNIIAIAYGRNLYDTDKKTVYLLSSEPSYYVPPTHPKIKVGENLVILIPLILLALLKI